MLCSLRSPTSSGRSTSWSVWARRTVMPCRRSPVGTFSRAPCIRQSLVRCLVCPTSSGFGFWEVTSWKTCIFCVPGSTVDDVHASFYGAFCALSHIFYVWMDLGSWSPRIRQSPGGVCLEENRNNWVLLGNDVTVFRMQRCALYVLRACVSLRSGRNPRFSKWKRSSFLRPLVAGSHLFGAVRP